MTMEASNDEKLPAILAEMRDRADTIVNERAITERNFVSQETVAEWADRIEAEVKRDCKEAVVCIAAIRKALEMFVNHASCLYHCDLHRFYPNATKCDGVLVDEGECPMKPECDAVFAGRAALAVPSRNCDRFVNELDAQLAFLNEVWLISVDKETMLEQDKYENWTDEMRKRYSRWLLAPATEQKGEFDGGK